MSARGSVLIHVLVTGVLVAFIAAGLLRISLMRYEVTARTQRSVENKRSAEAALNRALSYWGSASSKCTSFPGYTCTNPDTCACTCTPSDTTQPTIRATGASPSDPAGCTLQISTPDNALLP